MNHQRLFFLKFKNIGYLLLALLTGLLLWALVHLDYLSYAQVQRPIIATFDKIEGTVWVYPGNGGQRKAPEDHPLMRSNDNDQLWVAGSPISVAHMKFLINGQVVDPVVLVGGIPTSTSYRFPCRLEELGAGYFGWGFGSTMSVCNTVEVSLGHIEEYAARKFYAQHAQTEDESVRQITITRLENVTLVRVYNSNDDVIVDVLVGTVQISGLSGQEFTIDSGNRFIQSEQIETSEPIDLQEIADSPSIENFLNNANWSSEIEPLLDELKSRFSGESVSDLQLTDVQQAILDAHNDCRDEVNVPPLSWSVELANIAQDWADTLSGERNLRHRPDISGSGAGENLAAGSSIDRMLDLWKDEKDNYNPSTGQCRSGKTCGHYTQMVWSDTTEIGCGVASHRRYGNVMVCNYSPPGNYFGRRPY